MTVSVLPESWEDANAVRAVHLAAFPTAAEANLVQNLHAEFSSEISLVAKDEGHLIGHVMLSRMRVSADARSYRALGLGPIAVVPERQRQGVGCLLIEAALHRAAKAGEELVFVLGEPEYYSRFGFSAAAAAPFQSRYAGTYFMAKSFGVPLPASGTAEYAPAFGKLG